MTTRNIEGELAPDCIRQCSPSWISALGRGNGRRCAKLGKLTGLAAVGLAALFAFVHLGVPVLEDWDEGLHAKIVVDMTKENEWLSYPIDGWKDPSISKPPMLFYVMRVAIFFFGPSEFAIRFFPAISFVGLAGAVVAFCAKNLNARIGVWAVILICANKDLVFNHFARHGAMDAPLALCLAAMMFGLWNATSSSPPLYAHIALTCAALLKGIAAFQTAPAVILWSIVVRTAVPVRCYLRLCVTASVPLLLWVGLKECEEPGFFKAMISYDLVGRTVSVLGAAAYSPWFYLSRLIEDFGFVMVGAWLVGLWPRLRWKVCKTTVIQPSGGLMGWLLVWAAVPIALFSLARTQHPWYALPSYIPLSIAAGWLLDDAYRTLSTFLSRWVRQPTSKPIVASLVAVALLQSNWSRLMRQPARAEERNAEMRAVVAAVAHCPQATFVYRAYHAPALLFYLTRNGFTYRWADQGTLLWDHLVEPSQCGIVIVPTRELLSVPDSPGGRWRSVWQGPAYIVLEHRPSTGVSRSSAMETTGRFDYCVQGTGERPPSGWLARARVVCPGGRKPVPSRHA